MEKNVEIERCFICTEDFEEDIIMQHLPITINFFSVPREAYHISQYYTTKDNNCEIRFREILYYGRETKYEMTIKLTSDLVRPEMNFDITEDYYNTFKNTKCTDIVSKKVVEYKFDENITMFVNDVNNGALKYIDVEFSNIEYANKFNIYDYIPSKFIKEEMDKSKPKEYLNKE